MIIKAIIIKGCAGCPFQDYKVLRTLLPYCKISNHLLVDQMDTEGKKDFSKGYSPWQMNIPYWCKLDDLIGAMQDLRGMHPQLYKKMVTDVKEYAKKYLCEQL